MDSATEQELEFHKISLLKPTFPTFRSCLFADMVKSACGLSLWCFGLAKQLYSCTSVTEKEFRLFLEVGQCLDYAIAHAAESSTPIMMSDPIGMLWVAEYVRHNADTGYIILLGPVFDVTTSPQTLNDHLRGMNLARRVPSSHKQYCTASAACFWRSCKKQQHARTSAQVQTVRACFTLSERANTSSLRSGDSCRR